jgi:hypothetical protein
MTLAEIEQEFKSHRIACEYCTDSALCAEGTNIARRMQGIRSPQISDDAKYVAGKIVTHMWIIFVLLPVVLVILFAILKP